MNKKGYTSADHVLMVVPKTEEFKKLLVENFETEECKIPAVDYNIKERDLNTTQKATYGSKYFDTILNLSKHYKTITLSLKEDHVLKAETEDFIFLLAPRIEES